MTGPAPSPTPACDRRDLAVDVVEKTVLGRRSVRAFLPTPVPMAQVERLLRDAAHAPSNSNCQPWHVHVLTGEPKHRLTQALWDALDSGRTSHDPRYDYQPPPDAWPEPFASRRADFGTGLYRDVLGLDHSDHTQRMRHHRRNYDFFGAPVGLILTVSQHPRDSALVDAGSFLQTFMLLARASGLDTCPQASFVDYENVLREHLPLHSDHFVVCGVALGHADPDHRVNRHRTTREQPSSFVTFHDGSTS